MRAIVVATTPDSKTLANMLSSIEGYDKYPVIILSDYSYELGKIRFIYQHTDIEEFVLLHDSCEVKDTKLFEEVFSNPLSVSFSCSPTHFGSYLGKYQRSVLDRLIIPQPTSKLEAVEYEQTFNREYALKAGKIGFLSPELCDTANFITKFGRKVMVLENQYLIKYKSYWNRNQLK